MLDVLQGPWLSKGETLVCFGDSLTAADPGYVSILSEVLTPRGITVVNAGRGGDKTPWALGRLDSDVISRRPDAVSIFLGANDAAVGRGVWADEPRVTPETFGCNLEWLVHLTRLYGKVAKFSIATPLWRFEGATYAMHGDILSEYGMKAREAAENMRTLLVPLDVVFERATQAGEPRRNPETGLLFTKDGTHPTAEGNRLIADAMLKTWNLA